jgi:hypothetical protein
MFTHDRTHWQNVYVEKEATAVSWFEAIPLDSLNWIAQTGVTISQPMIDVGGGASTLVDSLLSQGYSNLTVLDIAGAALMVSQQRLGKHANCVNWIEADIRVFDAPQRYALWHDRAVFHFLTTSEAQQAYVKVLTRSLLPNSHLIMATFAMGGAQRCSGLGVVQYDTQTLSATLGAAFVLTKTAQVVHHTPLGHEQLFQYFHYIYQP